MSTSIRSSRTGGDTRKRPWCESRVPGGAAGAPRKGGREEGLSGRPASGRSARARQRPLPLAWGAAGVGSLNGPRQSRLRSSVFSQSLGEQAAKWEQLCGHVHTPREGCRCTPRRRSTQHRGPGPRPLLGGVLERCHRSATLRYF